MGYLGSKAASGAFQAVIAQMAPHDTYIETHLGSGVVLTAKPPSSRTIGLDLDPSVIARFQAPYPAELHQADCVAFLEAFDFASAGRVLVYADPPYVAATRASSHPKRYRHDYTDADHERLIAALRALDAPTEPGGPGVAVILSGYPSGLYTRLLGDWRTIQFQVMTRGGPRTEQLWMNYPAGSSHWATFAGEDFTDRQRIKRKAARWAAHYRRLPGGERLAVLAALLAEHGS